MAEKISAHSLDEYIGKIGIIPPPKEIAQKELSEVFWINRIQEAHKLILAAGHGHTILLDRKIRLDINYPLIVVYRGNNIRINWWDTKDNIKKVGSLTNTNLIGTVIGYESGILNKKGLWVFLELKSVSSSLGSL